MGLAGLVGKTEAIGEAFHITSDEVLTWNEIYAEIAAALGVKSPRIVKVPTDFICQVAPQMTGTLKGDKAHPGRVRQLEDQTLRPRSSAAANPSASAFVESVKWLREHPDQQNLKPEVDELIEKVLAAWNHRANA